MWGTVDGTVVAGDHTGMVVNIKVQSLNASRKVEIRRPETSGVDRLYHVIKSSVLENVQVTDIG